MQVLPREGFEAPQDTNLQDRITEAAPDLAVLLGGNRKSAQELLSDATTASGMQVYNEVEATHPRPQGGYDEYGQYQTPTSQTPALLEAVPEAQPQAPAVLPSAPPTPQGPSQLDLIMQQNQQLIALLAQQQAANTPPPPDPQAQLRERVNEVAAKWGVDPADMTYMLDPIVQPLAQQTAQVEAQVRAMEAHAQIAQQYPEAIEKASEIAAYIQSNPALDQNISALWQQGNPTFALQTAYFAWKAANPGLQQQVTAQQEQTRVNEAAQAQIIGRGGERLTLPPNTSTIPPDQMSEIRGAYKQGYSNPLAQVFLSNLSPQEKAMLGMQQ